MVARAITIICKAHSDMDADTPKIALVKSELELYMLSGKRFVAFWASSKDLTISFADEVIIPNCSLPSIASLRLNFISFEAIYFESFIWSVNYKATPLHKLIPFAIWKADKSQKNVYP